MASSSVDSGRQEQFQQLLGKVYPWARQAIIELELFTGEKSKRAVHELKDALDHMHFGLLPETTDEQATRHFHAMQEHLRRAAVEPVEYIAEKRLQTLTDIIEFRASWRGRILMLPRVPSPEARKKMRDGQEAITKCRLAKGQIERVQEAYESAVEARKLFEETYDMVGPQAIRDRAFTFWCSLVGSLVSLAVGGAIGYLVRCLAT